MKNFLLVVCSVLITYLLFEGVFVLSGFAPYRAGRVAKFQWIAQEPLRGWVNRPNFRHDAFTIDSRGFRSVTPSSQAAETIYCMGDSGTFGTWDDGTWPRFPNYPDELQKALDSQKIQIVNAGVIGYTTSHLLRQYMLQIRKLKPTRIVVRVGFNDHSPAWDVRRAVREPLESWKRFLIYRMGATFTVQTSMALRYASRSSQEGLEQWNNLDQFRFHLEALIRNARQDGVEVLLVDYPIRPAGFPGRVDGKDFPEKIWGVKNHEQLIELHKQYTKEIDSIAARLDVPLINTSQRLEDMRGNGFAATDIVHPAPKGYAIIAREIATYLQSHPIDQAMGGGK